MIGAIVGGLLYLTIYFNNRDIKKLSMPSNKDGLSFTIKNKELLDQSVLLEKGTIKNVGHIFYPSRRTENMSYKKEEPKMIILNSQSKVLSMKPNVEMPLPSLTLVSGPTKG